MKILGVDPGTAVMGYGVLDCQNDRTTLIICGVITTKARSQPGERLAFIYESLCGIIDDVAPDVVAVEQPFVAKNARTALIIGRAQAVAILAAAVRRIPTFEYSPAKVKQSVSSYGGSGKEQVQQMVKLQLGLQEAPQPADAADALAVALCHFNEMRLSRLIARQQQ